MTIIMNTKVELSVKYDHDNEHTNCTQAMIIYVNTQKEHNL